MKKIMFSIFVFIILISNCFADSGKLKSNSIIKCNNILYGYHSDHWHMASKNSDGSYSAVGKYQSSTNPCVDDLSSISEKIIVTLSSCIDGDTAKFIINNEIKSVRFLSIDTPESTIKKDEYGKMASDFTCDKLTKAKKIELEYDKNSDLTDKYGRILSWVWVNGYLLQDEIIKVGLGEVAYVYGKYKYTPLLQDHQAIAQASGLNIWAKVDVNSSKEIVSSSKEEFKSKKNYDLTNDFLLIILTITLILFAKKKKIKL